MLRLTLAVTLILSLPLSGHAGDSHPAFKATPLESALLAACEKGLAATAAPKRLVHIETPSHQVEAPFGVNRESVPETEEQREAINSLTILENHREYQEGILPHIKRWRAAPAIRATALTTLKNYFFPLQPKENTIEVHKMIRSRPFRVDNNLISIFLEVVPPIGADLKEVWNEYTLHLDLMMSDVASRMDPKTPNWDEAYAVAVWAKEMLLAPHFVSDANSRTAREIVSYVVQRIGHLAEITPPNVDIADPEFRTASTHYYENGHIHWLSPFNEDYKEHVRDRFISGLIRFAAKKGRRFFFLYEPEEDRPVPLFTNDVRQFVTLITWSELQTLVRSGDIHREEWATVRDYLVERIRSARPSLLLLDPAIRAEVKLINLLH